MKYLHFNSANTQFATETHPQARNSRTRKPHRCHSDSASSMCFHGILNFCLQVSDNLSSAAYRVFVNTPSNTRKRLSTCSMRAERAVLLKWSRCWISVRRCNSERKEPESRLLHLQARPLTCHVMNTYPGILNLSSNWASRGGHLWNRFPRA